MTGKDLAVTLPTLASWFAHYDHLSVRGVGHKNSGRGGDSQHRGLPNPLAKTDTLNPGGTAVESRAAAGRPRARC